MSRSPPLRFLILLLTGWAGIRAAWLVPGGWTPAAGAGPRPPQAPAAGRAESGESGSAPPRLRPITGPRAAAAVRRRVETVLPVPLAAAGPAVTPAARPAPAPAVAAVDLPAPERPGSRWSGSAWSFLREGDAAALAAGGLLGGSQAGLRLAYRLNRDRARPLALAARLTSPLRRPAAAEAALGLDWTPSRRLPLHLLAERRQRLGREGRSAFGLTLYGGVSDAALGPLRADLYAQAGIVGARSRDPFGDGALRLSLPLGKGLRLGAGAWAAAQPGAARLDIGPQASLRLPLAGRRIAVAADWRRRVAGGARPGSGPALTLATDF